MIVLARTGTRAASSSDLRRDEGFDAKARREERETGGWSLRPERAERRRRAGSPSREGAESISVATLFAGVDLEFPGEQDAEGE